MKHVKQFENYTVEHPKELIDFSNDVADFIGKALSDYSQAEILSQRISITVEYTFNILDFYYYVTQDENIITQFQRFDTFTHYTNPNFKCLYYFLKNRIPHKFNVEDIPEIKKHLNISEFELLCDTEKYNL